MTNVYMVGGAVRDSLMGVRPKDIDYAVETQSLDEIKRYIIERGGTVFLINEPFYTIRAKVGKETADYVLCRKDGQYSDGRRPDNVAIGTIYDDLARRDFTMNAIALDSNGQLIDPHGGVEDIRNGRIRCVGRAFDRFNEDTLRMVRAIRFSITKDMFLDGDITRELNNVALLNKLVNSVSIDRVRDELLKMFAYDTLASINILNKFPLLKVAVFNMVEGNLWLKPTLEKR